MILGLFPYVHLSTKKLMFFWSGAKWNVSRDKKLKCRKIIMKIDLSFYPVILFLQLQGEKNLRWERVGKTKLVSRV
jgi:hypothetical protein